MYLFCKDFYFMSIDVNSQKIDELLTRGVGEVIEIDSLRKKLLSGKQLRIKFGIDPTGSYLHLGHTVPLRKLRQFQDLGHQVILLIGDYTAIIGDPTGRDVTRPLLTTEQIKENMKTYVGQAGKILDIEKTEVRYNSEWYAQPNFTGLLMDLTSKITVARILERDDFQKRLKEGSDIQMQEIMYPLLQGYDSVALKADVELGGTDQKFNLLMGRKLQKRYAQSEQDIMTVPLLEGTDGVKKMSKSYGNFIALDDHPDEIFGKTMSVPDNLIIKYCELVTDAPWEEIEEYKEKILNHSINPIIIKKYLATRLVQMFCGKEAALKAQQTFEATFAQKQKPQEIPELTPSAYDIVTVLVEAKFVKSKTEARQVIHQGGVKVDDEKVSTFEMLVKSGSVVQKGSRFFVKII